MAQAEKIDVDFEADQVTDGIQTGDGAGPNIDPESVDYDPDVHGAVQDDRLSTLESIANNATAQRENEIASEMGQEMAAAYEGEGDDYGIEGDQGQEQQQTLVNQTDTSQNTHIDQDVMPEQAADDLIAVRTEDGGMVQVPRSMVQGIQPSQAPAVDSELARRETELALREQALLEREMYGNAHQQPDKAEAQTPQLDRGELTKAVKQSLDSYFDGDPDEGARTLTDVVVDVATKLQPQQQPGADPVQIAAMVMQQSEIDKAKKVFSLEYPELDKIKDLKNRADQIAVAEKRRDPTKSYADAVRYAGNYVMNEVRSIAGVTQTNDGQGHKPTTVQDGFASKHDKKVTSEGMRGRSTATGVRQRRKGPKAQTRTEVVQQMRKDRGQEFD